MQPGLRPSLHGTGDKTHWLTLSHLAALHVDPCPAPSLCCGHTGAGHTPPSCQACPCPSPSRAVPTAGKALRPHLTHWLIIQTCARIVTSLSTPFRPRHPPSHHPAPCSYRAFLLCNDLLPLCSCVSPHTPQNTSSSRAVFTAGPLLSARPEPGTEWVLSHD